MSYTKGGDGGNCGFGYFSATEYTEATEIYLLITDYADYTGNFDVENERSLGRIVKQEKEELWQSEK